MTSRIARLFASCAFMTALLVVTATPVAAECDGPVPSFRGVASTAQRVVIGDVTTVQSGGDLAPGSDGRSSRFTFRVRYVLRGTAPDEIAIRDLPTQPCAAEVIARVGDRIAIAFDATDPPIQVNTVAWIRGTPPDFFGVETITTADVFRLLHQEAPDTSIAEPVRSPTSPFAAFVIFASAPVGLIIGWRRVARR